MRESEVENFFQWAVEHLGGKSYKFKSVNNRGVADRVVMLPDGTTWFVELKALGKKLKPLQEIFRLQCERYNQKYAILQSIPEVETWAAEIKGASIYE